MEERQFIKTLSGKNRVIFMVFLIILFLKLYFNKGDFVRNPSVAFLILNFANVVWFSLLNLNNNPTQEPIFAENKFFI